MQLVWAQCPPFINLPTKQLVEQHQFWCHQRLRGEAEQGGVLRAGLGQLLLDLGPWSLWVGRI